MVNDAAQRKLISDKLYNSTILLRCYKTLKYQKKKQKIHKNRKKLISKKAIKRTESRVKINK